MTRLLLDLGSNASKALDACRAAYDADCKAGRTPTPAGMAVAAVRAVSGWTPEWKGKAILTPAVRQKLADALGTLAFNLSAAERGHPLV